MGVNRLIPLKVLPGGKSSPFRQVVALFLVDCEARGRTHSTRRNYGQFLTWLADYLEAQNVSEPDDVTATHLRAYLVDMQRRELKPSTTASAARIWRVFFGWLVSEELIDVSPMRKVKTPSLADHILPAFDVPAVERLLDACTCDRDRAMILTLIDTGCRASEFVGLDIGDVDITSGQVRVREGKRRKDRFVFLSGRSRLAIKRYLRKRKEAGDGSPLWASLTTGNRLTVDGLRVALARIGERAGVEHCHPHTFRRTFCLWAHRGGMDLEELRRIMGHEDLTVIRQYLDMNAADLAEAHREHGPVDRWLSGRR